MRLLFPAVLLALTVAACGASPPALTAGGFADRANVVCGRLMQELEDIDTLAAGVPALERAAAELGALRPPERVRPRVARWLRGFDGALRVMRRPGAAWEDFAGHGAEIEDGAWALGAYRCAGPEATAPPRAGRVALGAPRDVVIDTDMGSDDWIAILYLLGRSDVQVRAITVSGTGLAHCGPGVRNARRLLALAGRSAPVACGREGRRFPAAWRRDADRMLGVRTADAPAPRGAAAARRAATARGGGAARGAAGVIRAALREPGRVSVLTLGPLTNVADAFAADPALARRPDAVVVMGGAFRAPGNAPNGAAEWNVHADPAAADAVLRSGARVTLVPLDATSQVPLTRGFVEGLRAHHDTPAARFVLDVLTRQRDAIEAGGLFFWDELAAVALTDDVATTIRRNVNVTRDGRLAGWTADGTGGAPVRVAARVDRTRFERLLLGVLATPRPG